MVLSKSVSQMSSVEAGPVVRLPFQYIEKPRVRLPPQSHLHRIDSQGHLYRIGALVPPSIETWPPSVESQSRSSSSPLFEQDRKGFDSSRQLRSKENPLPVQQKASLTPLNRQSLGLIVIDKPRAALPNPGVLQRFSPSGFVPHMENPQDILLPSTEDLIEFNTRGQPVVSPKRRNFSDDLAELGRTKTHSFSDVFDVQRFTNNLHSRGLL